MNLIIGLVTAAIGFILASKINLHATLAGYSFQCTLLTMVAFIIAGLVLLALAYVVRSFLNEYTREATS